MDVRRSKAPRKKAGAPREKPYPLPVPIGPHAKTSYWPIYTGFLSGDRVYVRQHDAVIRLYRMGYFGKGTLSKHAPTFHLDRKAELFDLKQHLQKITHKVFLTRTFCGSLASGCRGPTQLVSASSLARQQPFSTDRYAAVGSQSEVPETATVAKLVDGDSGSCTDSSAHDATGRSTALPVLSALSDEDRDAEVSTPFCSVSAVAATAVAADRWPDAVAARAAAWESMEPDVDFWLGGTEHAPSLLSEWAATGEADVPSSSGASRSPDLLAASDSVMGSSCLSSSDGALQLWRLHDSADAARDMLPATQAERTCESATLSSGPPTLGMGGVRCEDTAEDEEHPSADTALPTSKGEHTSASDDAAKEDAIPEVDMEAEPHNMTTAEAKPERKEKQTVLCEHLELLMEEAYFLSFGLGCLHVVSNDSCDAMIESRCAPGGSASEKNADAQSHHCADHLEFGSRQRLGLRSLWSVMCARDPRFLPRYIAYHYLRSKGWVPRDGLRFGVDFVVYKTGPPFYHASYSVIVMATDSGASLAPAGSFPVGRAWTWASLAGVNRVTENVNKELLICYVVLPDDWTVEQLFQTPDCIKHCRVQFVHMQRLITSKEREAEKFACGSP